MDRLWTIPTPTRARGGGHTGVDPDGLEGLPCAVVGSDPPAGAEDVDPTLDTISVTFSAELDGTSVGWSRSSPKTWPNPVETTFDGATATATVALVPSATYAPTGATEPDPAGFRPASRTITASYSRRTRGSRPPADRRGSLARRRSAIHTGRMDSRFFLPILLVALASGCRTDEPRAGTITTGPDPDPPEAVALASAAADAHEAGDDVAARKHLDALLDQYPDTDAGRFMVQLAAELSLVGAPAPALAVHHWVGGSQPDLATGTNLLVFFEPWCPHSAIQVPRLAGLAGDAGIPIVGITSMSRNASQAKLTEFLEPTPGLAVGIDPTGSVARGWQVLGPPAAAVVRDGVVTWRGNPRELTVDDLKAVGGTP